MIVLIPAYEPGEKLVTLVKQLKEASDFNIIVVNDGSSYMYNVTTRLIFSLASGQKVRDTQTGLRGFPVSVLPWLVSIEGERFEYEMNMLLKACSENIKLVRVKISTIYHEGNKSTHFHPLRDSALVFLPIAKFCFSSMCGAVTDYFMLFVIAWLTGNLFVAVVGTAVKYYLLVCTILILNYLILRFLTELCGIHLFWGKILTELILFVFSFGMQHLVVFREKQLLNTSEAAAT